ncbi:MAG: hypothetical protein ABJ388_03310 [Alphaproteobacteria bacterium]
MTESTSIVFRTHAAPNMGLGHLTRCVNLALCLEQMGAVCRIAVDRLDDRLRPFLKGCTAFELYGQETPEVDEHEDARRFLNTAVQEGTKWIIVDDYRLGQAWEQAVRVSGAKVAVIDDLVRRHDCDLIIDTLWRGKNTEHGYDGLVPQNAAKCLGPRYTMLGPEYETASAVPRRERDQPFKITLGMGGGGDLTLLADVIEAIVAAASANDIDVSVAAVLGPLSRDQETFLARFCDRRNVRPLIGRHDLFDDLRNTDLYVGAAGGTINQLLALGVPSISFSISAEQASQIENLEMIGHYFHLGTISGEDIPVLADLVLAIERAYPRIKSLCRNARLKIDGKGCARIAGHILENSPFGRTPLPFLTPNDTSPEHNARTPTTSSRLNPRTTVRITDDRDIGHFQRCRQRAQSGTEYAVRDTIIGIIWWLESDARIYLLNRDGKPALYFWRSAAAQTEETYPNISTVPCSGQLTEEDLSAAAKWLETLHDQPDSATN